MSGLPRLTDWINGRIKPKRRGVYERLLRNMPTGFYARWDGQWWYLATQNPRTANDVMTAAHVQDLPWRGLAEPPQ